MGCPAPLVAVCHIPARRFVGGLSFCAARSILARGSLSQNVSRARCAVTRPGAHLNCCPG
eukprot:3855633-Pyramimonas_sp.AAC.1